MNNNIFLPSPPERSAYFNFCCAQINATNDAYELWTFLMKSDAPSDIDKELWFSLADSAGNVFSTLAVSTSQAIADIANASPDCNGLSRAELLAEYRLAKAQVLFPECFLCIDKFKISPEEAL